ncbi:hypothetical protein SAMN04487997_0305 [Frateuria terrea]|uniref:Uncharacterized protein n=1 Tax=Frateuria terrea TaxID=529704 RepID=A0A1H7ADM7_9GAMM|nr:hypothetical protein SAMN04487997_0305 [Frateuria terrea]SFP65805.1 hypothetical protein SAMN02927913_3079 [Frateuria terrea]
MSKYVVHYEMRKANASASFSKTAECETEHAAIRIAEAQGRKDRPGYDFNLKRVEKK